MIGIIVQQIHEQNCPYLPDAMVSSMARTVCVTWPLGDDKMAPGPSDQVVVLSAPESLARIKHFKLNYYR